MQPNTDPIVRGQKVWLRGFTEEDVDPYSRFVNTSHALWAGYTTPQPIDKVHDLRETFRKEHGKDAYYFVVSPLGSDDFLGMTWVWNLHSRIGGAEFSIYMADPGQWGGGLGTDATAATLDFVFGYTEITRLWLTTSEHNVRAQRSFEKSGFVREGLLRETMTWQGNPLNVVFMAILRREWEALERPRSWDLS